MGALDHKPALRRYEARLSGSVTPTPPTQERFRRATRHDGRSLCIESSPSAVIPREGSSISSKSRLKCNVESSNICNLTFIHDLLFEYTYIHIYTLKLESVFFYWPSFPFRLSKHPPSLSLKITCCKSLSIITKIHREWYCPTFTDAETTSYIPNRAEKPTTLCITAPPRGDADAAVPPSSADSWMQYHHEDLKVGILLY